MGFKEGSFAKVWDISSVSDGLTKLRISISKKDRRSGEYVEDFSGYVTCAGSVLAKKALELQKGDRIRLGNCDVTTKYDRENKRTYTNFYVYSFEKQDGSPSQKAPAETGPVESVDSLVDDDIDSGDLPY